jgi:hypothetical protein
MSDYAHDPTPDHKANFEHGATSHQLMGDDETYDSLPDGEDDSLPIPPR